MVPSDGSKYSKKAEDLAIEIANKHDAKIVAIYVINENLSQTYEALEDFGNIILNNITKKAKKFNVNVVEHLITGDPLRDMKFIAKQSKSDLIVISPYGSNQDDYQNQYDNLFFGSITDRVLKTFDIPILIVK
jgi:nucleotide-binding universal stress UspA family protein